LEKQFEIHLNMRSFCLLWVFLPLCGITTKAQPVPAEVNNIPWLVTFGPKAEITWGDDDHSQTFFFVVPENYKNPIYIKVFDPDTGGENDEVNGVWDTQMLYSVYGGKGAYSNPDAQGVDPVGNYKSGNLLASKTFGNDPKYDNKWYSFGPFNPTEGEYIQEFKGYIFKVICDGISGDDGNMYRYYLSSSATDNIPIEGSNSFGYEWCFRLWDNPKEVSHIYPYIDDRTIAVRLANFDWDDDGIIRVVSVRRQGQDFPVSGDGVWQEIPFNIYPEEKNTSLDLQFIKRQNPPVLHNNVVINVRNQYKELIRFYSVPIGGVPKYKYTLGAKKVPQP
jgi:hypothetical protein